MPTHRIPSPKPDGLKTPEVGEWSRHKHHFLYRYLDAFTTAMKDKPWKGLHYVDLFAGAGNEKIKNSSDLEWGSPLLAAQTKNLFTRLHICEKSRTNFQALQSRLARFPQPNTPQVIHGDANSSVGEIVAEIPSGSLSLAFLDPYGLHLDFDTVATLSRTRVDLIIFFPDRLDALRNWKIYEAVPNSNLDRFLGAEANWLRALKTAPPDQWAGVLRKLYETQLRKLGYKHFDFERISAHERPLYLLIFASKHKAGATIWSKVALQKPDKQRTFDFE